MRVWDTSQQAKCYSNRRAFLRERLSVLYACYSVLSFRKDGHIVVENLLFQELPTHEVGRTLYRFTGSYDGERSLPHKVLRLMEQEKDKKDVD